MKKNVPVDEIKALAEDVRLIQDFAENHNFNASLLRADVLPSKKTRIDLPLISMISCIILVLLAVAVMQLWQPPLSPSVNGFIFIVGLVFVMLASMSTHTKFKDKIVTGIATIGLLMVLFIGGGIFTPEQAVDKAGEFAK